MQHMERRNVYKWQSDSSAVNLIAPALPPPLQQPPLASSFPLSLGASSLAKVQARGGKGE